MRPGPGIAVALDAACGRLIAPVSRICPNTHERRVFVPFSALSPGGSQPSGILRCGKAFPATQRGSELPGMRAINLSFRTVPLLLQDHLWDGLASAVLAMALPNAGLAERGHFWNTGGANDTSPHQLASPQLPVGSRRERLRVLEGVTSAPCSLAAVLLAQPACCNCERLVGTAVVARLSVGSICSLRTTWAPLPSLSITALASVPPWIDVLRHKRHALRVSVIRHHRERYTPNDAFRFSELHAAAGGSVKAVLFTGVQASHGRNHSGSSVDPSDRQAR
mmetsp:Transcript_4147/g.9695  ORF Transcript_4147/g.9695 Transcript_4147/m.9695 type:complete len:279 (+) Transcript_4147:692-1528(+)